VWELTALSGDLAGFRGGYAEEKGNEKRGTGKATPHCLVQSDADV